MIVVHIEDVFLESLEIRKDICKRKLTIKESLMVDDKRKRSVGMKTIGEVHIHSDENGMITLCCDRCGAKFKVEADYLNKEYSGELYCPVCGMANDLQSFYPQKIIEEAKKIAMMEAEEIIASAFKGFNSKYIKVKQNPIKHVDREISIKDNDYDMQIVTVTCCNKKISLHAIDITAGFYCPYCGRIEK